MDPESQPPTNVEEEVKSEPTPSKDILEQYLSSLEKMQQNLESNIGSQLDQRKEEIATQIKEKFEQAKLLVDKAMNQTLEKLDSILIEAQGDLNDHCTQSKELETQIKEVVEKFDEAKDDQLQDISEKAKKLLNPFENSAQEATEGQENEQQEEENNFVKNTYNSVNVDFDDAILDYIENYCSIEYEPSIDKKESNDDDKKDSRESVMKRGSVHPADPVKIEEGIKPLEELGIKCNYSPEQLSLILEQDKIKGAKLTDDTISRVESFLSEVPMLNKLNIQFYDLSKVTQKPISKFSSTLQAISGVQELYVNLSKMSIKEKAFSPFYYALAKLSELEKLTLIFTKCPKVGEQDFADLCENITDLPKLKDFTLQYFECEKVNNDGMQMLRVGLSKLSKLEKLTLGFQQCKKLTNTGMLNLVDFLSGIQKRADSEGGSGLKEFNLCLRKVSSIHSKSVNPLMEELVKMTNLERLALDFTDCGKFDKSSGDVLHSCLAKLKKVTQFSISFAHCGGMKDDLISKFGSGIGEMRQLNSLYIDLGNLKDITNAGLKSFCTALPELGNLTSLTLDWNHLGSKVNFETITNLWVAINKMPNLKSVSLNLAENSHFKDDDAFLIAIVLKKLEIPLAHLTLNMGNNKNFTNNTVDKIISSIETATSLESFELHMNSCKMITTDCILKSFVMIGKYKNLKRLCLDFTGCDKVKIEEKERQVMLKDVSFMESAILKP